MEIISDITKADFHFHEVSNNLKFFHIKNTTKGNVSILKKREKLTYSGILSSLKKTCFAKLQWGCFLISFQHFQVT